VAGVDVMADDPYARIAQLAAELRQSCAEEAALREEDERRDCALANVVSSRPQP
jgi:hypothetical protein